MFGSRLKLLLGVTITALVLGLWTAAPIASAAPDPPSIVLVVTDDQRWDTVTPEVMPRVTSHLVEKGVTFTNAFVPNPLCCPSRASILTGKYSHGTGVYSNSGPHGLAAFDESSTLATWLDMGGYRTAFVGKYLNGYRGTYIPPGWDSWFAFSVSSGRHYYDYSINDNGALREYGSSRGDYSTDVLGAAAASFVRSTSGRLFLLFAPNAPHFDAPLSTTPPPRYEGTLDGLAPWRPPSFDEPDVSDKPRWIRRREPFTTETKAAADHYRQSQLEALRGVDDAVDGILEALRDTGRLDSALIVFTSDNGMLWGEHRRFGKGLPYEESIRVPMVVRYDPVTTSVPRYDRRTVLNVDLAPTLAAVGGVASPDAEGLDMAPLLQGRGVRWRGRFLLESVAGGIPPYCGFRTRRYLYAQYEGDGEELYDLVVDPFQLRNTAKRNGLRKTLVDFRLRISDKCSPRPPGFSPRSPCLIRGDSGANDLAGTRFYDYTCGRGGDDRISAGRGHDDVFGGTGDDTLRGGPGRDKLFGRAGNDVLLANEGAHDVVECGRGDDTAVIDEVDDPRGCETVRGG
jgi:N-acetylglucosamine-6-sulfatase